MELNELDCSAISSDRLIRSRQNGFQDGSLDVLSSQSDQKDMKEEGIELGRIGLDFFRTTQVARGLGCCTYSKLQ